MSRIHRDWLTAYLAYTAHTEAPTAMRFWAGVSAISGALRRRVWIDQAYFKWYPNMYILFVAPPGVVAKSTTSGIAMSLLRGVEGVRFGPDVVTWEALVVAFSQAAEAFEYPIASGTYHTMSALTLESSELGNLLDPENRAMIDLYVSLWDGKQGTFSKVTKTSGSEEVPNPWINMVGCTTPAWIAGNFPDYMIGGGFTSRCVFVYAEEKERVVAYPIQHVPAGWAEAGEALTEDLRRIANLVGEYRLTPEAYAWGTEWYHRHIASPPAHLFDDRFGGYLARKQTHIHKLAMVLAASRGDSMWIEAEHLAVANSMVSDLEPAMVKVFGKIGRSPMSMAVERLERYVRTSGKVSYEQAFRHMHTAFPDPKQFEAAMGGLVQSGSIALVQEGQVTFLMPKVLVTAPTAPNQVEGSSHLQ